MHRKFAIVRVKPEATAYEFPLSFDELGDCPLAGPFNQLWATRLDLALGHFPFARRTGDGRRAWLIEPPFSGTSVIAWLTSDGSLFVEGNASLQVIYGLLVHLSQVCPGLVVEDRLSGLLHNQMSLLRIVRCFEQNRVLAFEPFETAA